MQVVASVAEAYIVTSDDISNEHVGGKNCKIFKPYLLPNRKSDWAETWWEASGQDGDSELLKLSVLKSKMADTVIIFKPHLPQNDVGLSRNLVESKWKPFCSGTGIFFFFLKMWFVWFFLEKCLCFWVSSLFQNCTEKPVHNAIRHFFLFY